MAPRPSPQPPAPQAPETSRRVLVLGRDPRSFLATVRSLGRLGLEVHGGWHPADSLATRSRHLHRLHDLPPVDGPDFAEERWLEPLEELLSRERFELVFPTDDPATVALFQRRARLEARARLVVPGDRAFAIAFDKLATWELARSLDIPVPRQVRCRSVDQLREARRELGWPLVLKPRRSWLFGCRKWEHVVKKPRREAELIADGRCLLARDEVLAQEHFDGIGVGVEVLARHGEVLLAFQHERLHEPALGGGSSYRRGRPLDPELLDATRRLMAGMQHTGLAMVEFRRRADGAWRLIEINARLWGSLPLAVASGADFPAAAYRLFTQDRIEPGRPPRDDLFCRNLTMDFWWALTNRRVDRADPHLCSVSKGALVRELLNPLLLRERSDTLALDDLRPAAAELARLTRAALGLVRTRLRRLPEGLGLLRARRARSLRDDLAGARRLLFLCKGNVARSPFAAELARRLVPASVELRSAGYYRPDGRPVPPEAELAAEGFDVDLRTHRSATVDARDLAWADRVLVFDRGNLAALARRFPGSQAKAHLLGSALVDGRVEIADPYGGGLGTFETAYGRIERALRVLFPGQAVGVPRPIARRMAGRV